MKCTIAAFAAAVLLTCGAAARGEDKFDPAVKKLMPKDQLDIVERMEALAEKHGTLLFRVKDAKKRREENERLATEARGIQDEIANKLKTEGLKGWVGKCSTVMPGTAVILDSWQPIHVMFAYPPSGKPTGAAVGAVAAIKVNDVIRFSTKPDPDYAVGRPVGKTYHGFDQPIKIDTVTSVETVAAGSAAPPAKPRPGRKKP
jgi:hypothetical protein